MKHTRMMLFACTALACMNLVALADVAQAGQESSTDGKMVSEPATSSTSRWKGTAFPEEGSLVTSGTVTDSIPVDPVTGKRPGILDWAGMGLDTSAHPDGPGHDPMKCNICR